MDRYAKEIGLPFKCFSTIGTFDEEVAAMLKAGGCYCVEFGLQTWNEAVRRKYLNRPETNEQARAAFQTADSFKLWYDIDHMFNIPWETEEDHRAAALEYRRLKYLNRIKVHYLVYLPGAPIVSEAVNEGLLASDIAARLGRGVESDFYDQEFGDRACAVTVSGYAALFKLLPALPGRALDFFLKGRRLRLLSRIPALFMALLQGLLAARSRDRRFVLYEKAYPRQVAISVARALRLLKH
jgi:hypothetical protein